MKLMAAFVLHEVGAVPLSVAPVPPGLKGTFVAVGCIALGDRFRPESFQRRHQDRFSAALRPALRGGSLGTTDAGQWRNTGQSIFATVHHQLEDVAVGR